MTLINTQAWCFHKVLRCNRSQRQCFSSTTHTHTHTADYHAGYTGYIYSMYCTVYYNHTKELRRFSYFSFFINLTKLGPFFIGLKVPIRRCKTLILKNSVKSDPLTNLYFSKAKTLIFYLWLSDRVTRGFFKMNCWRRMYFAFCLSFTAIRLSV